MESDDTNFGIKNIKFIVAAITIIVAPILGSVMAVSDHSSKTGTVNQFDLDTLESHLEEKIRNGHDHLKEESQKERIIMRGEIIAEIEKRRYVDEKECQKEKQAIRDRVSVVEQNQAHCMRMLRQHNGVTQ